MSGVDQVGLFGSIGGSDVSTGATISDCGRYRYMLWRTWDRGLGNCGFVMLNPSTADAAEDDPTIRRCIGFARAWGFGSAYVANIFAFRATKPADLRAAKFPVGPENDRHLIMLATQCTRVVVAWGASCRWKWRQHQDWKTLCVLRNSRPGLEQILCLGTTKAGFPRHPLYVRGDTTPVPYVRTP